MLQAPWACFVTVTNRQGRQSWPSGAHPCRRVTHPADEVGTLAAGLFLLKQKQYGCWHLTPLGEGTAAQTQGPGPQEGSPRPLWCPLHTARDCPGKGLRGEVVDLPIGDFHSRPQLPIDRRFSHVGRTPGQETAPERLWSKCDARQ